MPSTSPPQAGNSGERFNSIAALVAGVILIAASALKAAALGSSATDAIAYPLIIVEWTIGWWLLSAWRRRAAVGAAGILFACFATAAAYKTIRGDQSCGCFGTIDLRPTTVLVLDLLMFTALAFVVVRDWSVAALPRSPSHARLATCCVLAITCAVMLPTILAKVPSLRRLSEVAVGKIPSSSVPPDLLERIDVGAQLKTGHWTVLLHRDDCPACKEALSKLLRESTDVNNHPDRLAVVEVNAKAPKPPLPQNVLFGRLQATIAITTPYLFRVVDGRLHATADTVRQPLETSAAVPRVLASQSPDGTWLADCGYVEPAGQRELVYEVRNDAAAPINIVRWDVECGCTTLREPPKVIPARGVAVVPVGFHAPAEKMVYTKQIVMLTDSKEHPKQTLKVTARVGLPLSLVPLAHDFGGVEERSVAERFFDFENAGATPIRLLYAVSDDPDCYIEVPATSVPGGQRVKLRCVLDASAKPPGAGAHAASIRLVTSDEQQHVFNVRVSYRVNASPGSMSAR